MCPIEYLDCWMAYRHLYVAVRVCAIWPDDSIGKANNNGKFIDKMLIYIFRGPAADNGQTSHERILPPIID